MPSLSSTGQAREAGRSVRASSSCSSPPLGVDAGDGQPAPGAVDGPDAALDLPRFRLPSLGVDDDGVLTVDARAR